MTQMDRWTGNASQATRWADGKYLLRKLDTVAGSPNITIEDRIMNTAPQRVPIILRYAISGYTEIPMEKLKDLTIPALMKEVIHAMNTRILVFYDRTVYAKGPIEGNVREHYNIPIKQLKMWDGQTYDEFITMLLTATESNTSTASYATTIHGPVIERQKEYPNASGILDDSNIWKTVLMYHNIGRTYNIYDN